MFILVRVRAITVAQTANVASMIMPKITQEGMIPPRRRMSAREPISSSEISRTGASGDTARDGIRCERIRSSTQ
jgi:predicted site-specific integrase-resolvase